MKAVRRVGSSRRDVRLFPQQIRSDIGYALYAAQIGETDPAAKALKGFGAGASWRLLHRTTAIPGAPARDIDLIRQRLAKAERDYRERQN